MNSLFLLSPLLIALALTLIRRWPRVTVLSSCGAACLLALLWNTTPEASWALWGQPATLTTNVKLLLVTVYLFSGLIFGLSWLWPFDGRVHAAAWLSLGLLSFTLLLDSPANTPLLLLVACLPLSWLIQTQSPKATDAATGFLKLAVVGIGLLFLGINLPTTSLNAAASLVALGTLLLLAGFPTAIWLQTAVLRLPPLILIFLFGPIWLLLVQIVLQLLQSEGSLVITALFQGWLQASGVLTLLLGAAVALLAKRLRGLVAALLILDNGVALLTLTLLTVGGGQTAVLHQLVRGLSLLLIGLALNLLEPALETQLLADNKGLGRKRPFATALLGIGLLSLLGLPLTIGFSSRWAVVAALSQAASTGVGAAPWLPLLLLLSVAAGLFAVLRGFMLLLEKPSETESQPEALWQRGLVGGLLTLTLLLAAFPQLLLRLAQQLF